MDSSKEIYLMVIIHQILLSFITKKNITINKTKINK